MVTNQSVSEASDSEELVMDRQSQLNYDKEKSNAIAARKRRKRGRQILNVALFNVI